MPGRGASEHTLDAKRLSDARCRCTGRGFVPARDERRWRESRRAERTLDAKRLSEARCRCTGRGFVPARDERRWRESRRA